MTETRAARIAGLSLTGLWLVAFMLAAVAMNADDGEAETVAQFELSVSPRVVAASD